MLQPAQQDDIFSTVGLESPRQEEKKTEAFSSLAVAGMFVRPIKLGFSCHQIMNENLLHASLQKNFAIYAFKKFRP